MNSDFFSSPFAQFLNTTSSSHLKEQNKKTRFLQVGTIQWNLELGNYNIICSTKRTILQKYIHLRKHYNLSAHPSKLKICLPNVLYQQQVCPVFSTQDQSAQCSMSEICLLSVQYQRLVCLLFHARDLFLVFLFWSVPSSIPKIVLPSLSILETGLPA